MKALMEDPTSAYDRAILDDMNLVIENQIITEITLSQEQIKALLR